MKDCKTVSSAEFVRVEIPTTSEFLAKWHVWIHGKVSKHFKRDKERIPDTAQRVRLRLLSKDFISRWFFKHLTDDLVDLSEFIRMTGNKFCNRSTKIHPVHGNRYDSNSLWRVSDILFNANFDYERYFYSVQNHTIDTDKFLRLLGIGSIVNGKWVCLSDDYGVLESLYRQGRIKPSELTEHDCADKYERNVKTDGCSHSGCDQKHFSRGYCRTHYRLSRKNVCQECERGKRILAQNGVSLNKRWSDPSISATVSRLRWNDSQLIPFLREWQRSNMIKIMPRYIMRRPKEASVDAGLLKYANMVIDNDVFNHFKSMIKSDDIGSLSIDIKIDPDSLSTGKVVWDSDDRDLSKSPIYVDNGSYQSFLDLENNSDLKSIINRANLSKEEMDVISLVDLSENSIMETSSITGFPISKVNRIRSSAIKKLRSII